jgi:hypothetical protein
LSQSSIKLLGKYLIIGHHAFFRLAFHHQPTNLTSCRRSKVFKYYSIHSIERNCLPGESGISVEIWK